MSNLCERDFYARSREPAARLRTGSPATADIETDVPLEAFPAFCPWTFGQAMQAAP